MNDPSYTRYTLAFRVTDPAVKPCDQVIKVPIAKNADLQQLKEHSPIIGQTQQRKWHLVLLAIMPVEPISS